MVLSFETVRSSGALLDADHVVKRAGEGGEGSTLGSAGWRSRRCAGGQIDLLEEAVRPVDPALMQARRSSRTKCFRKVANMRSDPPPSLGRIGRDLLDAELVQSTINMGRLVLVHRAARLWRIVPSTATKKVECVSLVA